MLLIRPRSAFGSSRFPFQRLGGTQRFPHRGPLVAKYFCVLPKFGWKGRRSCPLLLQQGIPPRCAVIVATCGHVLAVAMPLGQEDLCARGSLKQRPLVLLDLCPLPLLQHEDFDFCPGGEQLPRCYRCSANNPLGLLQTCHFHLPGSFPCCSLFLQSLRAAVTQPEEFGCCSLVGCQSAFAPCVSQDQGLAVLLLLQLHVLGDKCIVVIFTWLL